MTNLTKILLAAGAGWVLGASVFTINYQMNASAAEEEGTEFVEPTFYLGLFHAWTFWAVVAIMVLSVVLWATGVIDGWDFLAITLGCIAALIGAFIWSYIWPIIVGIESIIP